MADVMRFEKDFASGDIVGRAAGRIIFPHGIMRLVIFPDGIHAVVERKVVENDFQIIDGDLPFRLAPMPGDEDTQRSP